MSRRSKLVSAGYRGGSTTVAADVLVIPITHGVVKKTLGADAEALTLANGVRGQILDIEIVTAGGGTGTLTPSTATGFTTIEMTNAGDRVTLCYLNDTDGWVIVGGTAIVVDSEMRPFFKEDSTTVAADVLAIPVTHGTVLKTTGADAEALTLADGEPGQLLNIQMATDGGGDGTLTPTTSTGFATIVFADAGDQVTLLFRDATIGWTIVGAVGVAAPPAITV